MPLYEYACAKCAHTFEALVFDGEAVECPECNSTRLERLLSVPAPPQSASTAGLPMSCGEGPPCGAPGCRRIQR
jgi:putative FmdB family regulatory protein